MKRKPRWTLEMLTASLAVLCGLLLLVLLVQRPTAWLLLAVLVIPFLEILIIPAVQPKKEGKSVTDRVHDLYRRVLAWTFRHGWLTISMGIASVIVSLLIATQLKLRMVPFACLLYTSPSPRDA